MHPVFTTRTQQLFGNDRYRLFAEALSQPSPVAVRLNPFKPIAPPEGATPVPWCSDGYWLDHRPDFTLDPLLHAGCYYVQDAASMFLDQILRQHVTRPVTALDLCAAPGGKATLARSTLPTGSMLYANEPDRRRANILVENLQKQGHTDVVVTSGFARDYATAGLSFDLIIADLPCSGEGMMRKDPEAVRQWTPALVDHCCQLGRSIIEDIWPCLNPGGILVYSTCTLNTAENEENIKWITENLGAEVLPVDTQPSWGITGSLLEGFAVPVFRFIPGITPTEGLFLCVMRKTSDGLLTPQRGKNQRRSPLNIIYDGKPTPTIKGNTIIPAHAEALLASLPPDRYPSAEVDRDTALQYLRRESITLPPDTPKGHVVLRYKSWPLGFVKNIGNRANNLYPQEWRIRHK